MKRMKALGRMISILVSVVVLSLLCAGCQTQGVQEGSPTPEPGSSQAVAYSGNTPSSEKMKFGVAVYNTEDAEVLLFRKYFVGYLANSFDVDFLYSGSISSTEDELEFIEDLHNEGAAGVISFYGIDLDPVLTKCDEYGMYYVMGSGSISDRNFEKASAHDSFLGIIGPDRNLEKKAGADMTDYFVKQLEGVEKPSFLIVSGGAHMGNEMHYDRALGMLEALKEAYGLDYASVITEIAGSGMFTDISTGSEDVKISILPGYLGDGRVAERLEAVLDEKDYDVVLGTLALDYIMPTVEKAEKQCGHDILVGTVDAFTDQNYEWFSKKDAFGNNTINYVVGKYAATVGPSFAAMYNACSGNADFLRPDGKPFRLVMPFWVASDLETYEELYSKSANIYDNIYSTKDLRSVIKEFNPKAEFKDFQELTEREWQ